MSSRGARALERATYQSRRAGRDVRLARTNLGISRDRAAALAGVSRSTQRRVEDGDPNVGVATLCRVAEAVGLDISIRAFLGATPTLRDTGQLRFASYLRGQANPAWQAALEVPIVGGRSADMVFFGATEIILAEIERLLEDYQAQYRSAEAKRVALQEEHGRPVRLVLAVEDTRRNRAAVAPHLPLIQHALPAGSRDVLRALQRGSPLGRDGLLWVRIRR